jgi:UDP-N-acetylmuramoyl-tripeptide--D-alanyl-D-alanine ligase
MYRFEQDDANRAALDKGLEFILKHSRPGVTEGSSLIAYADESSCATGTVALTALAIIEYLRTANEGRVDLEAGYRLRLETALDGYLAHLRGLRLSDGRFSRSYSLSTKAQEPRASASFDGQALLCLTKAAKYLGRAECLPVINGSALAMAKYYTADQWPDEPDSDLTKSAFPWCSMAFWEIHDAGWENAETFGDCVLSLAWWMIHTHATLTRQRNTAYAYEGLIHAYQIAQSRGDAVALKDLSYTIDEGLWELTSWQVAGPLAADNQFLTANPTSDLLAVGGILSARQEPLLQVDVARHQMHAVILALKYVYPEPTDGAP